MSEKSRGIFRSRVDFRSQTATSHGLSCKKIDPIQGTSTTMDAPKHQSPSRQSTWKETLVIALVGWIPSRPGRGLRKLLYRTICARIGECIEIQPGVEFTNASGIEIGDWVRLHRDVRIRCNGENSKVRLRDWAHIDRGVDFKTHRCGEIEIGENSYIGPYTCLSGDYIKVGRNCMIASHSGLYANNHNFADPTLPICKQGNTYKGITIEEDCWLGSGVKVLDGVTIGRGSVIGAGAVVTKDIPPYSIAVGVPAKVVSQRSGAANQAQDASAERMKDNSVLLEESVN